MDPFTVGLVGSAILIIGAAWPVHTVPHPAKSVKNWLFTVGSACMFGYAVLNYFDGGSFFFILLQILIAITTVLMMFNTKDTFDISFIGAAAAALVIYSLYLFEGVQTVFFVIGLSILGIGFALNTGTYKRNMALGVGSAVIAGFSYLSVDWIFFGLNFFFAAFSFYHAFKLKLSSNSQNRAK
jgi:hypothetical protein